MVFWAEATSPFLYFYRPQTKYCFYTVCDSVHGGGGGVKYTPTRKTLPRGVLVLLVSVQILVRLDCFSHSITMEV